MDLTYRKRLVFTHTQPAFNPPHSHHISRIGISLYSGSDSRKTENFETLLTGNKLIWKEAWGKFKPTAQSERRWWYLKGLELQVSWFTIKKMRGNDS